MAKRQTRRTISYAKVVYEAALERAKRLGISVSELGTRAFRAYGLAIPETSHAAPAPTAATRKAQETRAKRSGPRAAIKRLLPARRKPTKHRPVAHRAVPSKLDLERRLPPLIEKALQGALRTSQRERDSEREREPVPVRRR